MHSRRTGANPGVYSLNAGAAQRVRRRLERGAGGHDIVDEDDVVRQSDSPFDGESRLQIAPSLIGVESGLRGRRPGALQDSPQQRQTHCRRKRLGQLERLVVAALTQARRV